MALVAVGSPAPVTLRGAEDIALVDVGLTVATNENFRVGISAKPADTMPDHCWRMAPGIVRCRLRIVVPDVERCSLSAAVVSTWSRKGRPSVWGRVASGLTCDTPDGQPVPAPPDGF
jgi:hypothetical protein